MQSIVNVFIIDWNRHYIGMQFISQCRYQGEGF